MVSDPEDFRVFGQALKATRAKAFEAQTRTRHGSHAAVSLVMPAPPLAVVGCLDRLGCEILCGTENFRVLGAERRRLGSLLISGWCWTTGRVVRIGWPILRPERQVCGGGGVIGARLSLCPRSVTLAYPAPAVPYPSSDDSRRRRRRGATVVTPRRTTPRRIGAGPPQNEVT
jgi:hypothetical protein